MLARCIVGTISFLVLAQSAEAQSQNNDTVLGIVRNAIQRRIAVQHDTGLEDFRARAHGFVFFLGQFGEGLSQPPILIKSDQLELEVYWRAPDASKQRIIGWRDRIDLPTDIRYHRDHLGIVQNDFGNKIRMGGGHEVSDVPHPLSPNGPGLYDYILADSLTIRIPQRDVRVVEVRVRPKEFSAPRIVGSLFIDVEQAEVVRLSFKFTPSAYLDPTIEDITLVLDNGLWEGRYWLPRRQEIEIRRRTKWLDLPARGIIRGRWEIDSYEFNVGLEDSLFLGPEIIAAPIEVRDLFPWSGPIDDEIGESAASAMSLDLETIRSKISDIALGKSLSGLARARPGAGSASEILHFNRVEGLAPGGGGVLRPAGGYFEIRGSASYGIADQRPKGSVVAGLSGKAGLKIVAAREVRDVADESVISGVLNSLLAQEAGYDFGDYALIDKVMLGVEPQLGAALTVSAHAGYEKARRMRVAGKPARGVFRSNPDLASDGFAVVRLGIAVRVANFERRRQFRVRAGLEGGVSSAAEYGRVRGDWKLQLPVGTTDFVSSGWVGWGSRELPRHRSFVFGGRGTMVGERFRSWGGRYTALGKAEWRISLPIPAIRLGSFSSTGNRIVAAPFATVGWAAGADPRLPWRATDGGRVVVGLAVEWFHGLIRIEAGWSLSGHRLGAVADVRRDFWDIL